MLAYKKVLLNDGRECILRTPVSGDAPAIVEFMRVTAGDTEFLSRYPEEIRMTVEEEGAYLDLCAESSDRLMILAEVDGQIAGDADIHANGHTQKTRHRAGLGIAVRKEYWGLGIASKMMDLLIRRAKEMGYLQLELEVVATNERGIRLYEKYGFKETGRNEKGFRLKDGTFIALISMALEL